MNAVKSILVPTDFSEAAKAANPHVMDYARAGAKVHLLHVLEHFVSLGEFGWTANNAAEFDAKRNVHAHKTLKELAEGMELGEDVTIAVEHGSPFDRIVDYAGKNDIDLIVMATHGRTGLNHLLMGSQAERVVRTAPCPVLTVRAK